MGQVIFNKCPLKFEYPNSQEPRIIFPRQSEDDCLVEFDWTPMFPSAEYIHLMIVRNLSRNEIPSSKCRRYLLKLKFASDVTKNCNLLKSQIIKYKGFLYYYYYYYKDASLSTITQGYREDKKIRRSSQVTNWCILCRVTGKLLTSKWGKEEIISF